MTFLAAFSLDLGVIIWAWKCVLIKYVFLDKLGTWELAYFHRLSDSDGHEKMRWAAHILFWISVLAVSSLFVMVYGRWAACKMFMESCLVQLGDLRHMNNNPLDASRLAKFCLLLQIEWINMLESWVGLFDSTVSEHSYSKIISRLVSRFPFS